MANRVRINRMSNVVQPGAIARVTAMQRSAKNLHHSSRYRTRLAIADRPIIKFADGRYLGGGAGHECLIRDVHRIAREKLLRHRDACITQDTNYRGPSDAG